MKKIFDRMIMLDYDIGLSVQNRPFLVEFLCFFIGETNDNSEFKQ